MGQADRPASRATTQTAFTLLELILVLAIVAVLLGVAAANLRGFYAECQVDDAASHLVAMLHQGRERAIRDAHPYRLRIDPQEQEYQLMRSATGSDGAIPSEWGRPFALPESVRMQWGDDPSAAAEHMIEFRPDGSCDRFSVVLVGSDGRACLVALTGSSGDITVEDMEEVELAERSLADLR